MQDYRAVSPTVLADGHHLCETGFATSVTLSLAAETSVWHRWGGTECNKPCCRFTGAVSILCMAALCRVRERERERERGRGEGGEGRGGGELVTCHGG